MLEEPVPASEINTQVSRMISSNLKNYRVIPVRPDRDYISFVRHFRLHSCLVIPFFILAFI